MTVCDLLRQAEAAGITIKLEGESLLLRGPSSAKAIGEALLARKPVVVAALQTAVLSSASQPDPSPSLPEWNQSAADEALRLALARVDQIESWAPDFARDVLASERDILRRHHREHNAFLFTAQRDVHDVIERNLKPMAADPSLIEGLPR